MYDVCSGCDNKINPSARPRARARALETTRRRVGNTEREDKRQKTKRQRGFPACSQASTNAPQAGLSSLFRWGRLIFCWCERLMGDSARGVSINMMTCIGRETLMGHFCTTRENENDQSTKQTDRPKLFTASNELDPLKMTVFVEKHARA